jgi:hypothetical protein
MKEVNKNRKDEVLSHQSEVNIDEIWAAIEPQVDIINAEKKRRKGFAFFFLFGAILLVGGGLYLWQNGLPIENSNTVIEAEMRKLETAKEEAAERLMEEEADVNSQNQASDNQTINNSKATITKEKPQEKIAVSSPTQSTFHSQKNTKKKTTSSSFANSNKIATTPLKNETLSPQINTNKEASNKKTASAKVATNSENSPLKVRTAITPSPIISSRELRLSNLIPDVGEVNITSPPSDLPGGKLSFAVAANTGISFINRGLASNIEGNPSPEVLRLRRESETLLEAIHYGLRTKLTHKSGFSFSTGAQYTVISERYDNNNLEVASDSIMGITKRVVQFNGDTIDMIGLVPRTTTYDYEKKIYNRYKMIDVPFIIGFEGGMKEWSLGIQAGVFLNLALNTSGQIRSTLTEDINIGDNQADVFKSKVGLSYYGGIYIRRALSQNLDITIAPHGRFFAQDFNVEGYDISQKYSLIGIQAALSYRFGY